MWTAIVITRPGKGDDMGLDLTIYRATRKHDPFYNPFAPEPPEGHHWSQIVDWRDNHKLAEALFPGAGSPDWKILTVEDMERGLGAVSVEARDVAESLTMSSDTQGLMHLALRTTATVLRSIRNLIADGDTYMVEVIR